MTIYSLPGRQARDSERIRALEADVRPAIVGGSIAQINIVGPTKIHGHNGLGEGGVLEEPLFAEGAAPATPPAGHVVVYAKSDGHIYQKDDAGTESDLTAAGGHDAHKIIDDDTDTYVSTEESADSDVIESASGGTIRSRLSALGLQLANGTDLTMYSDAFSSVVAAIDGATGHSAWGPAAGIDAAVLMKFARTYTDPSAGVGAIDGLLQKTLTTANAQDAQGISVGLQISGAFADTGINAGFRSTLLRSSASTAADMRNFDALAQSNAGATMTARYAYYARDGTGAGAITNQYGFYVPTFAKGGALNWAFYSVSAASFFGGIINTGSSIAVRFFDGDSSHYTGLKAHATTTASVDYTLPPAVPASNGYLLASTTAGVMSWAEDGSIAHLADTSDAHDASAISIADAGGHYTATEVEAALQEVAVEARNDFKSGTIFDPTAQEYRFLIAPYAFTITEVKTNIVGGTSVTFNIKHGTNPTSGTADLWSSDEVANTSTAAETHSTSYNDATIADEEVVSIEVVSVSGSVTQFMVTVYFTRD